MVIGDYGSGPVPARSIAELAAALAAAAGADVELERPSDAEHGDYATNVALRLAPARKRAPRELAEELAGAARALPAVERAEVAGPGFLNLFLRDAWFVEPLWPRSSTPARASARASPNSASASRSRWSRPIRRGRSSSRRRGTARSATRSPDCLTLAGHEVEREYYYNDAGAQMERFRASVEAVRRGEEPPEDGYRGEYVRELAAIPGDPVPAMLERIEASLERFRIHFDSWALQSRLEERLPELLPRLDTYERDGALWARSSEYGDEQDRVLLRSETREPTYRAADVVYLVDKLERGFDRAVYVLGADHHGTRNWYAAVARMLGYDPERVEVLLYQLVHLTRGGEQTKMSKRRGDVVFLDEFMDEIGVDAARWYLVNRSPTRRSRSTSTWPPSAPRRTRSTTCSTPTRGSPGCSGTQAARRHRPSPRPRSRPRSVTSSSGCWSSPRSRPRRSSGAGRTGSRRTRSASPTSSTASITTTASSRARRSRSAWDCAGRRRR